MSRCDLCGHVMSRGEEMFKRHGQSGPCPSKIIKMGDNCFWHDWNRRRFAGPGTFTVKAGDILHCPMESGKTAKFKVIAVKYPVGEAGEYVGTAEDVEYEDG